MAGLIGLDWGTSTLRAFRFDGAGRVGESRTRPWGIRHLPDGGFEAAFAAIIAGWPALPRLACGMVGARGGWREMPYLDAPAGAEQLACGIGSVRAADGREVHLVPGLRDPRGPDMLRGEETQLAGGLALVPGSSDRSTWVLPGTHSKWVSVRAGIVTGFHTVMTGELFALLGKASILGTGAPASDDGEAFDHGVRTARDSGPAGALSRLFSARALLLDGALQPAAVSDYLSGLLIGEELRSALAAGWARPDERVQLLGEAALCARYRRAAAVFGMELPEPPADAAAHGLWQLALRAGLVRAPACEVSSC